MKKLLILSMFLLTTASTNILGMMEKNNFTPNKKKFTDYRFMTLEEFATEFAEGFSLNLTLDEDLKQIKLNLSTSLLTQIHESCLSNAAVICLDELFNKIGCFIIEVNGTYIITKNPTGTKT